MSNIPEVPLPPAATDDGSRPRIAAAIDERTRLIGKLLSEAKCPQPYCDSKGMRLVPVHSWYEQKPCDWCKARAAALAP